MTARNDVVKAIAAMAQIYGRDLNADAAAMFLDDLNDLEPAAILAALQSCRRELRTFPTVADIVARVQQSDGRPGVEEAWAMIPKDEEGSVVWTSEMAAAFGVARPLMLEGDMVGARMAFKERYQSEVKAARERGQRAHWVPSLGYEPAGRIAAVRKALDSGRLSIEDARHAVPEIEAPWNKTLSLTGPAETDDGPDPVEQAKRIRAQIASIGRPMPGQDTNER